MHSCNVCNYFTIYSTDLKKHLKTKKHINNYKTYNLICNNQPTQQNQNTELKLVIKDYESKLEIERLKNELEKKDLENKNLQLQIQLNSNNSNNVSNGNSNNTNCNNTIINITNNILKCHQLKNYLRIVIH